MSYKNCEKRGTCPTKNAETVERPTNIAQTVERRPTKSAETVEQASKIGGSMVSDQKIRVHSRDSRAKAFPEIAKTVEQSQFIRVSEFAFSPWIRVTQKDVDAVVE